MPRRHLTDLSQIWHWIQSEWDDVHGRSPNAEETIAIVLTVSAVTKMLEDQYGDKVRADDGHSPVQANPKGTSLGRSVREAFEGWREPS